MGFWELVGGLSENLFYAWGWPWLGLPGGILFVLGSLRAPRVLGLLMLMLSAATVLVVLAPHVAGAGRPDWHVLLFVGEFLGGAAVAAFAARETTSLLERWRGRWMQRSPLAREARTDIRTVGDLLPKARDAYDPLPHCGSLEQIFLGLDSDGDVVHVDQALWRNSHVDIVGMTGSGKGILAGVLLTQAVRQGEAVVVVDPKDDEYAPRVMARAAREAGVPFYRLDLMAETAQWNPLRGKTADEIEELLVASLGLGERGTEADFYRLNDRRAAREFAQLYDDELLPILLETFRGEPAARKATKFIDDMEEIVATPSARAEEGLDIAGAIAEGAVIYVRGSVRHARILKLQKMFVLSVIQHCERRAREEARQVCLFLDEFRYLVSAPVLEALASIRDKRAHLVLAHQTVNDLRNVPGDLDPEQVVSSVTENCGLKFSYRVNDPDTALWLARMSGNILVDDEVRSLETNTVLAERERDIRSLRQSERYLVDTNMLQSLPPCCAVNYGNGLARFVFTSPVPVE